jgi:hypothetical protein
VVNESDIALMFIIAELKAAAGLADIYILACHERERIYASCVVGSRGGGVNFGQV